MNGAERTRDRRWRIPALSTQPLWALPDRVLAAVLIVEVLAAALIVADLILPASTDYPSQILIVCAICSLSLLHTESVLLAERLRRRVTETGHVDLTSVWTFAAALLLPPAAACGVASALYAYSWLRVWRPAKVPLYRHVFSTATMLLAIHAASGVVARFGVATPFDSEFGWVVVVLAMLAYTVVNTCLVVGVVALSSQRSVVKVLGSGDEVALEIATLSLGGLTAAMLSFGSPAVILVLPPLLLLHRSVLARQLERAADTDGKTGLLSAAAWQVRATKRLHHALQRGGGAAFFILDIDHFKKVNDTYGHLTGDLVLSAVGAAVSAQVRSHDLVGRFGGEEFVVLVDRHTIDHGEVHEIAERIRQSVGDLILQVRTADGPLTIDSVTVSVGAAHFPTDGTTTDQLMRVADQALYAAKRGGRNSVRVGSQPFGPGYVDRSGPTRRATDSR